MLGLSIPVQLGRWMFALLAVDACALPSNTSHQITCTIGHMNTCIAETNKPVTSWGILGLRMSPIA